MISAIFKWRLQQHEGKPTAKRPVNPSGVNSVVSSYLGWCPVWLVLIRSTSEFWGMFHEHGLGRQPNDPLEHSIAMLNSGVYATNGAAESRGPHADHLCHQRLLRSYCYASMWGHSLRMDMLSWWRRSGSWPRSLVLRPIARNQPWSVWSKMAQTVQSPCFSYPNKYSKYH